MYSHYGCTALIFVVTGEVRKSHVTLDRSARYSKDFITRIGECSVRAKMLSGGENQLIKVLRLALALHKKSSIFLRHFIS